MRRSLTPLLLTLALITAGCGSDDADTGSGASGTAGTSEATTTSEAGPCPTETMLELVNGEAAVGFSGEPLGLASGPIDVATEFADASGEGGADLVFATYEIPEDPQFGLSAPVGDPGAPAGSLYFNISITTGGDGALGVGDYRALEPGEGAIGSPGDITDPDASIPDVPPSVNFEILYEGPERISIGDHSVTLTEVTDTRLCGEITGDTRQTDLQAQGFPVIDGPFIIDRI